MNFAKRKKSIVDFLFVLAVFGTFAVSALFVVLFGAKVYQKTVDDMDLNYEKRTALSYVTEKIRSHDFTGGADVADVDLDATTNDEHTVLKLYQDINGKRYITYLFVADGYLKEFTADENYEFDYSSGAEILPIKAFYVKKETDSLYRFNITDESGEVTDFFVTLYSGTDGEEADE